MENQIPNCDLLLECPDIGYFDIVEGLYNRCMHDTLFSIFGYLDDISLRNAEVVSKVWKTVMSDMNQNKMWKNLLQHKIKSSNLWMNLCSSTVCQLNQLSTDNHQYFPKFFNKVNYVIKTLSKNWLKSDYTRDYLDCGFDLNGCCLQTGNKLMVFYDINSRTFMIWNRLTLRLIENYKYPSKMFGDDFIDEGNVELYEDALVFPLMTGKIVIRNTARKTTEEHKPFGMDGTKSMVYLRAQNGFLCAAISSRSFFDRSYFLVWKFNSLASVDWENFKMIPLLAPDSFSRIHMDNNFFILQTNYPDEVVCEIRTMSDPRETVKEIKFTNIIQKEIIYYKGCIASVRYNFKKDTATIHVSFKDIESGRVKLIIETNLNIYVNPNHIIRIQSDFLIVCKDVGHPSPSKNILVWNLKDAMKLDVDASVPPYCVFEAFIDETVYFNIDAFGIVILNEFRDVGELCRIMIIDFLPLCGFCKKVRKALKLCSRCKSTKYCGTICQKADWRHHKKMCHQICKPLESLTFPIGWNFGYFGNGTQ